MIDFFKSFTSLPLFLISSLKTLILLFSSTNIFSFSFISWFSSSSSFLSSCVAHRHLSMIDICSLRSSTYFWNWSFSFSSSSLCFWILTGSVAYVRVLFFKIDFMGFCEIWSFSISPDLGLYYRNSCMLYITCDFAKSFNLSFGVLPETISASFSKSKSTSIFSAPRLKYPSSYWIFGFFRETKSFLPSFFIFLLFLADFDLLLDFFCFFIFHSWFEYFMK